jgi:hypothetical protein
MKALLVADKDSTRESLLHHLAPRGFDLIHYRHPIKAMDNIDEIDPEVVFFSAEDFPRHWKPFLTLMRESIPKERTTFVLLKGEVFSSDEVEKAKHLAVDGIIRENLTDRKEFSRLEELLAQLETLTEERGERRYVPGDSDDIEFIFTHPQSFSLITGTVFDLSPNGVAFVPDDLSLVSAIPVYSEIRHCSLRINDKCLSFRARVVRNAEQMGLLFSELDDEQQKDITLFIEQRAEKESTDALGVEAVQL